MILTSPTALLLVAFVTAALVYALHASFGGLLERVSVVPQCGPLDCDVSPSAPKCFADGADDNLTAFLARVLLPSKPGCDIIMPASAKVLGSPLSTVPYVVEAGVDDDMWNLTNEDKDFLQENIEMDALRQVHSILRNDKKTRDDASEAMRILRSMRYLTTSEMWNGMGLTNLLMAYASMFVYAAIDRRIVLEPLVATKRLDSLIDIDATEINLARLFFGGASSSAPASAPARSRKHGFGIFSAHELFDNSNEMLWKSLNLSNFSAVAHHIDVKTLRDLRNARIAKHGAVSENAFVSDYYPTMQRTADTQLVVQGRFCCVMPPYFMPVWYSTVLRCMTPKKPFRDAAKALLQEMVTVFRVKYWMAVHLRAELSDGRHFTKNLKPADQSKLILWWTRHVTALADKLGVDTIYIASGQLSDKLVHAIFASERRRGRTVLLKSNFSRDVYSSIDMSQNTLPRVTSIGAALVDALVLKEAHAVVTLRQSTLQHILYAYRCPALRTAPTEVQDMLRGAWCKASAPQAASSVLPLSDFATAKRDVPLPFFMPLMSNSTNRRWFSATAGNCTADVALQNIGAKRKVLGRKLAEGKFDSEQKKPMSGLFFYRSAIDEDGDDVFTPLVYVSCNNWVRSADKQPFD